MVVHGQKASPCLTGHCESAYAFHRTRKINTKIRPYIEHNPKSVQLTSSHIYSILM